MAVTGIGGLFFRSGDPDARVAQDRAWQQQAGDTVFAPFPVDSDYFAADQPFMLNLRVTGLSALVSQLEAAGITVDRKPEWDSTEYGSFARIHDPEGLPIELWEPPVMPPG